MRWCLLLAGWGVALAQSPVGQVATRDVHSLLWLGDGRILLGHHDGLQVSKDGGRTWQALLSRQGWDAMNLAWDGQRLIVAGHDIYAESTDLKVFRDLKPKGLSGSDLHGYLVSPVNPALHFAHEASGGLFMSRDGGRTWSKTPRSASPIMTMDHSGVFYSAVPGLGLLQSRDNAASFAAVPGPETTLLTLAVASDGGLYAAGKNGLWLRTSTGWRQIASGTVVALAVNPRRPAEVIWVDGTGRIWRR